MEYSTFEEPKEQGQVAMEIDALSVYRVLEQIPDGLHCLTKIFLCRGLLPFSA